MPRGRSRSQPLPSGAACSGRAVKATAAPRSTPPARQGALAKTEARVMLEPPSTTQPRAPSRQLSAARTSARLILLALVAWSHRQRTQSVPVDAATDVCGQRHRGSVILAQHVVDASRRTRPRSAARSRRGLPAMHCRRFIGGHGRPTRRSRHQRRASPPHARAGISTSKNIWSSRSTKRRTRRASVPASDWMAGSAHSR